MTNTRHKFIIIDLICNIHTVLLIYVINLTNYNNISYLGAIRSWPFHRSFSNEIQYGGRERVKRVAFIKKKKILPFLKKTPKYLLMKELESYCGTIDDTIYAYVEDYHTCSGIFS